MARTKAQTSALTALSATETTKTSIGDITVSKLINQIVFVWVYVNAGAGITTLENRSGIFEVSSTDYNVGPFVIPVEVVMVLTSGVGVYHPRLIPVKWDSVAGLTLTGNVTLDLAQTVNPSARWGIIGE